MNSYLLSFLAILCLGPWTAARGVYETLRKNSVEVGEEAGRNIIADAAGLPIINGFLQVASQARTWAQWLRRLLKALRKWHNSHPPEVKLGKCFASYFNIKIPGLRQNEKFGRYNETPKGKEHSFEISERQKIGCHSQKRSLKSNSLGKSLLSILRDFFTEMRNRFTEYRDVVLRNDLVVCFLDYFWKKFWIWVDTAPDFPCKTRK